MSHFKALKVARNEVGISKQVAITHLNTPSIFETANGMLAMVLKVDGVTFDAARVETLNQYKFTEHQAILALDDRFAVMVTTHRHKEGMELVGTFYNNFARDVDTEYHEQFRNSAMYLNDLYLTVIYKGLSSGKVGKGLSFISKMNNKAVKGARELSRNAQIKELTRAVNQLATTLAEFKPRILGEKDNVLGYSEVLSFLSIFLNAGKPLHLPFVKECSPIGKSFLDAKKSIELYPLGKISQFLTSKRIFFGDYIQFQGATRDDVTFAAMMTVKQYGNQSAPIMFDTLLHVDSDFISTHSYAVEAKDVTLNYIKRHIRRMENVGDPAVSQMDALHEALDLVASGSLTMGYHHNTVMILAGSIKELEKKIATCIKCYADVGFIAVRETLGQEPAFWAQVPTNLKYIARASLITSENFVDFAPLHNYRTGYADGNHLGSAVTILETPSKTPYRFNFHVRGSKDNPSKGHAILIGGNGAGKTAMMTFMDAQLGRYHGNTFYFDRDRGAEIYIRASEGSYSILSPNHPTETHFAPLQLEDTPSNRQFNRDLLIQFCKENESDDLGATIVEELTHCINYAYDHLAKEHRTFSNAVKLLPISFEKWPSLRRWLRSDGKSEAGEYAYIFDNAIDQLSLQKKMGFDMTHFLDNEPAHIRTPLMMYLFHRIDLSISGNTNQENVNLTTVMLDEGWQYFLDPYWEQKLKRVLPTWRKRNAHLVMGTQSPSSVVHSPLRHVIMDNVATQIYFANPQAKREDYIDGLKLDSSEYEIIRSNAPQSRLFLIKQEHEAAVCRLSLGHMSNVLAVLSGNASTVRLLDNIRKEVGDDPKEWLPLFHRRRLELRA